MKMGNENNIKVDFIGIGDSKAGSTWITNCLKQHPEIIMPISENDKNLFMEKEIHFFNGFNDNGIVYSNYKKGIEWYIKHFISDKKDKIRGEFSTSYLSDKKACYRIKKHFPNIKIIVTLRNPIDRIYSIYNWNKAFFTEYKYNNFDQLIKDDKHNNLFLEEAFRFNNLNNFFKLFPKKNIHIIIFEDIKIKPNELIKNLYSFLNVDTNFVPLGLNKKINSAVKPRFSFINKIGVYILLIFRKLGFKKLYFSLKKSRLIHYFYTKVNLFDYKYPDMKLETRKKLNLYYKDDIEKLEKLIGRNLEIWKEK